MIAREWTGAASSAEDAVRKGVRKLGLTRDQVNIRVLEEETSDLFSLFGFRRVSVKLTVKPSVLREMERAAHEEEARKETPRDHHRDVHGRNGDDRRDRREPRDSHGEDRDRRPRDRDLKDRGDGRRGREGAPRRDRTQDQAFSRERPQREESRRDRREPRPGREKNRAPRPPTETGPSGPVTPPETFLKEWVSLLGWDDLSWTIRNDEEGDTVVFDAASGARLSADGGSLLKSLEHLLATIRVKESRTSPRIFLEVEGQAPRPAPSSPRREGGNPAEAARRAAEEALRSGRPVRLEPMSARDRKVVHKVLAGRKDVETFSEGREPHRRVVVEPKND